MAAPDVAGGGSLQSFEAVALRRDDQLLRDMFLTVLGHHHDKLRAKLDVIFTLADQWCRSRKTDDFEELETYLQTLKPDETILIASAFSHMLNLHNISEHVLASEQDSPGDNMDAAIKTLMASGCSAETIYDALSCQEVDLVLTAHPTQALRESVRSKYNTLRRLLHAYHDQTPERRGEVKESMYACIQAAWRTDEIRRRKPTPQDEMLAGLAYMHSLFDVVPAFMARIDRLLLKIGQPRLPLDHAVVHFGSWMGGDRDGNPNVKPETTREVAISARLAACNLYIKMVLADAQNLMSELSLWRCSAELKRVANAIWDAEKKLDSSSIEEERKRRNYDSHWAPVPPNEPFRCVLAQVRDRLFRTREVLHSCLAHPRKNVADALEAGHAYSGSAEMLDALKLLYRSLLETGDDGVANTVVIAAIRRVTTFGMALVPLDIRQESTRHRDVMNAITEYLDIGSFSAWDEDKRVEWIVSELQSKRPLIPPGVPLTEQQQDVVDTFRILGTLPPDSLGAYIISMAQTPSDVLSIVLLQRELGVKHTLRVVPLFETLDDLVNAPATMERLFTTPWYFEHIRGRQEAMIGYSDSGKDAGRLAAAWALYQAQETLSKLARDYGVKLTLFHGRGGTVGRGGGPAHLAVLSQPPGTVDGTLRVTVQGETIEQQLGEPANANNTLDLYTSSVLLATLESRPGPDAHFRDLMQELADASCEAYRRRVHRSDEFVQYFNAVTPVGELGLMNIGSRPSKRKAGGGIGTLRAIPWIFAWTQTRFHLPVWLGVGEAFAAVRARGRGDAVIEMYQAWPFFRVTMDMMAMVMAKGDERILEMYEKKLADDKLYSLGESLRRQFQEARDEIYGVVGWGSAPGSGDETDTTTVLRQKLELRAPYVAPLNMLQAIAMHGMRYLSQPGNASGESEISRGGSPHGYDSREFGSQGSFANLLTRENFEKDVNANPETWGLLNREPETVEKKNYVEHAFRETLWITIKGIASGMQNTG